MRFLLAATLSSLTLALLPACDGEASSTPVGVDDVRKACELRATWKTPTGEACITCMTSAPLPTCGCPEYDAFAGKCLEREDAVKAEPTCTSDVNVCVKTCSVTDCDCIDRCYAQAEACRRVAGGRDGCVAEICAQHCN